MAKLTNEQFDQFLKLTVDREIYKSVLGSQMEMIRRMIEENEGEKEFKTAPPPPPAPRWPDDRVEPTGLWTLPGYNSSDESRHHSSRDYYNTLMSNAWSVASREERGHLQQVHQSRVNQAGKLLKDDKELWMKLNDTNQLPESCKAQPTYAVEDHPFKDVASFDTYALLQAAWDLRIRKLKFNLVGPMSFNYFGRNVKFVGMETYVLEWVDWVNTVNDQGEVSSRVATYYFRSAEASDVEKLYGISEERAHKLFGKPLVDAILRTMIDVNGRTEMVEIRQDIERKVLAARYSGTGMTFGAW